MMVELCNSLCNSLLGQGLWLYQKVLESLTLRTFLEVS